MRAGRITAGRFYQACHTSLTEPSICLIKGICYGSKFYSKATEWRNKNEKIALVKYKQVCTVDICLLVYVFFIIYISRVLVLSAKIMDIFGILCLTNLLRFARQKHHF